MSDAHPDKDEKSHSPNDSSTVASDEAPIESQAPVSTVSSLTTELPFHDGSLQRVATAQDNDQPVEALDRATTTVSAAVPVYSVFTKNQKRFIVIMASWAGFFSPVSANIYYPALNSLARDLRVDNALINLTLTSYMIFQGLAPAFIGDLADVAGRRPAYIMCFVLYIAANTGLALQDSYAALFVLRCLQSSGSSGTIALSSGVCSDIATAAERGSYMGFVTAGSLLGPAVGPVIGGILAQFLGWRAIFWFLVIFGAAFLVVFVIFFPETARSAVGNGSIPPRGFNISLMNHLAVRKARKEGHRVDNTTEIQSQQLDKPMKRKLRFPNPLSSIRIILDLENALLLFWVAFLFCIFYDIVVTVPSIYSVAYDFNDLQIGLCYIPFGVGSCAAAILNGHLLDRNFARWCQKTGTVVRRGRQQDLRNFPIEKARLEIAIPAFYIFACLVIIYGWMLDINAPLAVPLILLFLLALTMTASFNAVSTLLVDFYPRRPATATAANNLCRCLLGAGATALIVPMINAMGRGWTFTLLGMFMFATSPMVWIVYFRGMGMRENRRLREEAAQKARKARESSSIEEGDKSLATGIGVAPAAPPETTAAVTREPNMVEKASMSDSHDVVKQHRFHRTLSRESGF